MGLPSSENNFSARANLILLGLACVPGLLIIDILMNEQQMTDYVEVGLHAMPGRECLPFF